MKLLKTIEELAQRVQSLENDRHASRAGYPGYD